MRRTKYHIHYDILNLCKVPSRKTAIVYKCNLNFSIVKKYMIFLRDKGFLDLLLHRKRLEYATTEKGLEYINTLAPILS